MKRIGASSIFLSAISNRLAASSNRSRFLGMTVGMAISRLIEPPGKAMNFDLEEMASDEANRYMGLVGTQDIVGSLESLKRSLEATTKLLPKLKQHAKFAVSSHQPRTTSQRAKVVSIEEIQDSEEEEEEDDLAPYEKPDADPSDSEEDPTLIRRGKLSAPV